MTVDFETLGPVAITTWALIFLGALSLWWPRLRNMSFVLLGGGYLLALGAGLLDWRSTLPIGVLLLAAYAIRPRHPRWWRVVGHVLFVVTALALALHLLPGFHNPRVIGPIRFTSDAVPFTMYLNLDKPLAGYWLLLAWPALCLRRDGWRGPARGLWIGLVTAAVCLALGVALGQLACAPKWPRPAWLWALNNLLLVCLTEEAFFRGYLQEALSRRLTAHRHGHTLAVVIAATAFGAVHAAGGLGYVLAAGVAGVGYGLAYRWGGLQAAVVAHFGLNLTHFTLFTYPMLAA